MSKRPGLRLVVCAALICGAVTFAAAGEESLTVESDGLTATVRLDPFGISFAQPNGAQLTDLPAAVDPADPSTRYGTLGFAVGASAAMQPPEIGYGIFLNAPVRWFHATRVVDHRVDGEALILTIATDDPLGRAFAVRVAPSGDGTVAVQAELDNAVGVIATGWSFASPTEEHFLGLGERSDGADQTGNLVESWNEEGPFSAGSLRPYTEPVLGERWQGPPPIPGTNFSMPWFVSSRGYGFLLDSGYPNRFRLRGDRSDAWNVETQEPSLRYRVFAGPTTADVVRRFSASVGRQPEPAKWFFGPWYQPTGETAFRNELRSNWRSWDIPMTVAQTYTHYLPCGSHVGSRDGQKKQVADYHAAGYVITTYVNSFVCNSHAGGAYQQGDTNGYFVKTALGNTYPVPYIAANANLDAPYSAIVDFTNPAAKAWWQSLITDALEDGYDGWMEDFGEYVPPDAVMADGRPGIAAHNEYCTDYHRASHELTSVARGIDFAQFVRCGYTGTAPYARIVWGGDPTTDDSKADGLGAAVSQALSMGLSGVAYWGSDIGGFHALFTREDTNAELLTRWLEFGAFSGIMRTQAEGYARPGDDSVRAQIWDEEVRPVWRKYAKLRTQLFPYIWQAAQEYLATGMPMMRHLSLAYPSDSHIYSPEAEYEYLFGPDILVAPVTEEDERTRTLYLPPGPWLNFWDATSYDETTGAFTAKPGAEVLDGGRVITVDAPLDRIPLFVRAGSCIPLLPPHVVTLAEVGTGVVHLTDVAGQELMLGFGTAC